MQFSHEYSETYFSYYIGTDIEKFEYIVSDYIMFNLKNNDEIYKSTWKNTN